MSHERLVAEARAATRETGRSLPTATLADLQQRFGHDFSDVAVHDDPQAARRLQARAFTVGRHIVLGDGADSEVLEHEAVHVVQARGQGEPARIADARSGAEREAGAGNHPMERSADIGRAVITDATGTATDFEFRAGVELRLEFMQLAQQLIGPGVLHNRGLRALRNAALNAHGTVDDHERMFMAGLTQAANAALLRALRLGPTAAVTFPLATITPNIARVEDLGREAVPTSVTAPQARAATAVFSMDLVTAGREWTVAETAASREILSRAGSYRTIAEDVIDWATTRGVSIASVLTAMLNAGSDSSPGDRVFAALVYAVAQAAGMPEASQVFSGAIKVDAMVPSAFAALPGAAGMVAAYVTVSQAGGAKGDTIYVQTTLDVYDLSDRSNVVHELTHARDDVAAAGATVTFTDTDRMEMRAYRSQGRYLLTELAALPAVERPAVIATLTGRAGLLVQWGMLLETLTNRTRFEPLVAAFAAAATPSVPAATVAAMLNRGAAALETAMLADIRRLYSLAAGQQSPVDGLAGSSLVHWIFRI